MRIAALILLLALPMTAAAESTPAAVPEVPDFDALWDYGDPEATEVKFKELLAKSEDKPADYVLQLRTQIGRTLSLRAQFTDAHALLDAVEAELTDATPVAHVRYLLERGRTFNSAGDKDKARALFVHAWLLANEQGQDFHAVDAAHMVAIADAEAAMEWNLRALELAEKSADPRAQRWKGSLYNNIGWTHHDAGQYAEALVIFEKALVFRKEQGKPGPIRIARWCVARTWRSLGRTEEALVEQQALHAEALAAGEPDPYTLEELGECLHALGRQDEARPWFAQAYAALSEDLWLASNEPDRIARLKELGGVE